MPCIANKLAKENQIRLGAKKAAVKRGHLKQCGCPDCATRLAAMRKTAAKGEDIRATRSGEEKAAAAATRKADALAAAAAHETGAFQYGNGTMHHTDRRPESIALALRAAGYADMNAATRTLTDLIANTAAERAARNAERGCADLMIGNAPRWDGKGGASADDIAEGIAIRGNDNSDAEQARAFDHSNMGIAWLETQDRHGRKCLISLECHVGYTRNGAERAGAIVARLNWDGLEPLKCKRWLELIDLGLITPGKLRDLVNAAAATVDGFTAPEFLSLWAQTNGTSADERNTVKTPNYSAETLQMKA